MSAPKLEHSARTLFFWFYNDDSLRLLPPRTLLISQRYLSSFFTKFHEHKGRIAFLRSNRLAFQIDLDDDIAFNIGEQQFGSRALLAIVEVARLGFINLALHDFNGLSGEMVRAWLEVCRRLKEMKNLESIGLYAYPNASGFLVETLAAKLSYVITSGLLSGLRQLAKPLEYLYLGFGTHVPNFPSLFRSKVKEIEFYGKYDCLYLFHGWGPFHPNPHLTTLTFCPEFNYDACIEAETRLDYVKNGWTDYFLPRLEESLRFLEDINSDIVLRVRQFDGSAMLSIKTPDDAVRFHDAFLNALYAFIDLAERVQISLEIVKAQTLVKIPNDTLTDDFVSQITARLDLKRDGRFNLDGHCEYHGHSFPLKHEFARANEN